jgi:hypothetical protein
MQIAFDIQIDPSTCISLTYQILFQCEKPLKDYTSAKITQLTTARLAHMGIQVGDILEPIAPLCNTKVSKAWNGMIKLPLRSPKIDRHQLLVGKRIFALLLDGGLMITKVAKGYVTTANNDQLIVKIEGASLKREPGPNILTKIIKASFRRGQKIKKLHKSIRQLIKVGRSSLQPPQRKSRNYYYYHRSYMQER